MPITPLSTTRDAGDPTQTKGALEEFAVRIDFIGGAATVCIRGELDGRTAPTLGALLGALEEEGHRQLVLDLSALTFIGAGGLGLIAGTAARLRRDGGDMTLRAPGLQARRLLDITGISQRIVIEAASPEPGLRTDLARAAWPSRRDDVVDAKLLDVVTIAAAAVVGADGVSVSLARHGRISTVAASNETVMRMDDHQYATGQGPCLAATNEGFRFDIESLADEPRWPAFVPRAMAEGIGSILSTPLMAQRRPIGALNIYSTAERAFGPHQRELAVVFATHASQIAGGAAADLTDEEMDARIAAALRSRTTMALAQGILMARHRVTADEASATLHRSARGSGTTTLEEATDVVASTRDIGPLEELGHG